MEEPQILQKKLYFLLEQLQSMASELPPLRYCVIILWGEQERSLEGLGLAIAANNGVQHYISLFSVEEQDLLKQYENNSDKKIEVLQKFMIEQKEELKKFDMKLVLELDKKVADQQNILEQAGVPGFYYTTSPVEIKLQMYLLDFLLRLSQQEVPLVRQ
ncbi:gonadal protein gdl [Sitophilus oryzae]|uniref:Gonadal protein gdl n=1 Tax=Sitophilus oryzae TaxID=7048 RepID=A0A6J2XLV9_SITOR|nr:gonadal protein gdl [Sitophilus oryzae]